MVGNSFNVKCDDKGGLLLPAKWWAISQPVDLKNGPGRWTYSLIVIVDRCGGTIRIWVERAWNEFDKDGIGLPMKHSSGVKVGV